MRGLAALSAAFLDCCPAVDDDDEPHVKVERPLRSEDERR